MRLASLGTLLATAVIALVTYLLSAEEFLAWGWRIPFFIAGPMGIIGLYLRLKLDATAETHTVEFPDGTVRTRAGSKSREAHRTSRPRRQSLRKGGQRRRPAGGRTRSSR